jgi:hypothetical protein
VGWDDDSSMLTFLDVSEMEENSDNSLEHSCSVSGANSTLFESAIPNCGDF